MLAVIKEHVIIWLTYLRRKPFEKEGAWLMPGPEKTVLLAQSSAPIVLLQWLRKLNKAQAVIYSFFHQQVRFGDE